MLTDVSEVRATSETSVNMYLTTRQYIPETLNFNVVVDSEAFKIVAIDNYDG
jgi:hypothetical protein